MTTLSLITTRGNGEPTLRQLRRRQGRRLWQVNYPYPGMKKTVDIIANAIQLYRNKPFIRKLAMKLTAQLPNGPRTGLPNMRNRDGVADAIYNYIIQHTIYVNDAVGVETLKMPDATIMTGTGDCDDMAMLSAALLESVGIPCRIKLLGETADTFSHIFIEYRNQNGQWKSFDPTLALYPGYKFNPKRIKNAKVVEIGGSKPVGLQHQAMPVNPLRQLFSHSSSYTN